MPPGISPLVVRTETDARAVKHDASSVTPHADKVAIVTLTCRRWVTVSVLGGSDSVSGMSFHLDGSEAIALAVAGIIAGVAVAVSARSSRTHVVALLLAAGFGTLGLTPPSARWRWWR